MMDVLKPYRIPFIGLKEGVHHFEFRLDGAFFQVFENEELTDSHFDVQVSLDKKTTMLEVQYDIRGEFVTSCDRCSQDLIIPMVMERELIAKSHGDLDDDDIIALSDTDTEVDLSRSLYETVAIGLPLKRAHDEEDCDPEVIDRLDSYSRKELEDSDPRWDALKKLK
ncbi:MAG: DUF177 domain-containing protein [Flavobacteriales bacterium]|nr:DUF177 domain-containing protein [Flavobacteriales bacterium]